MKLQSVISKLKRDLLAAEKMHASDPNEKYFLGAIDAYKFALGELAQVKEGTQD